MFEIATTPFGRRAMSLGMMASQVAAKACPANAIAHKWQVFHTICQAKAHLAVSDRSLSVLNALLTFHPETTLTGDGDLVVFPSNRQLSLRAHGMTPATLRRHLAALVQSGLILRRDSPNGKRYARKGEGGEIDEAFGFDLTPLVARADEFKRLATAVQAERRALLVMRERITLHRRDITKMIEAGIEQGVPIAWGPFLERHRDIVATIPRTAAIEDLEPIESLLASLAREIRNSLETWLNSKSMSANESQSECHIHNSNPKSSTESELAFDEAKANLEPANDSAVPSGKENRCEQRKPTAGQLRTFPLGMVLDACPDIADYGRGKIASWRDLQVAADLARSLLGISPSAWQSATQTMGTEAASVVIAAMVQKGQAIKSPGGYLRNLTERTTEGQFSLGPMLMALMRSKTQGREVPVRQTK